MRIFGWILRVFLAVDFALLFLTFIPAFSGLGAAPGLADRLWGKYRLGGWRADIVWVCASSVYVVAVGLPWIKENREAKMTRIVWFLWLACFPIYLIYIVLHMF